MGANEGQHLNLSLLEMDRNKYAIVQFCPQWEKLKSLSRQYNEV